MENVKVILEDGIETDVSCIFYMYNSKYYIIYTEKKLDENGYVILHLSQIGKEIQNSPTGPVETGYMIGVEVSDPTEWSNVQKSITKIVDDKKNNTKSNDIQYLSSDMLKNLKILSKKTFKLMKSIVESAFKVVISAPSNLNTESSDNEVILDYRTRFFDEQLKNEELQKQIDELTKKIENVKKAIE